MCASVSNNDVNKCYCNFNVLYDIYKICTSNQYLLLNQCKVYHLLL